jgi:membrane-bound lytic murein transglycosylase D
MYRAKELYGADIDRIVHHYKGPAFGFASRNFYAEFIAVRQILGDLAGYFPEGVNLQPPLRAERVRLPQALLIDQIAAVYKIGRDWLEQMNPAMTDKALRGSVAVPAESEIWVPRGATPNVALLAQAEDDMRSIRVAKNTVGKARTDRFIKASNKSGRGDLQKKAHRRVKVTIVGNNMRTVRQSPAAHIHLVEKGDSPRKIATKYGVGVARVLAANDLLARSELRPGQRIRIPNK